MEQQLHGATNTAQAAPTAPAARGECVSVKTHLSRAVNKYIFCKFYLNWLSLETRYFSQRTQVAQPVPVLMCCTSALRNHLISQNKQGTAVSRDFDCWLHPDGDLSGPEEHNPAFSGEDHKKPLCPLGDANFTNPLQENKPNFLVAVAYIFLFGLNVSIPNTSAII